MIDAHSGESAAVCPHGGAYRRTNRRGARVQGGTAGLVPVFLGGLPAVFCRDHPAPSAHALPNPKGGRNRALGSVLPLYRFAEQMVVLSDDSYTLEADLFENLLVALLWLEAEH